MGLSRALVFVITTSREWKSANDRQTHSIFHKILADNDGVGDIYFQCALTWEMYLLVVIFALSVYYFEIDVVLLKNRVEFVIKECVEKKITITKI